MIRWLAAQFRLFEEKQKKFEKLEEIVASLVPNRQADFKWNPDAADFHPYMEELQAAVPCCCPLLAPVEIDGSYPTDGNSDGGHTGSGYYDGGNTGSGNDDGGYTGLGHTTGGSTGGGNTTGGNAGGGHSSAGNTDGGNTSAGNTDGGNTGSGNTGGSTVGGNTDSGNLDGSNTGSGNTTGGSSNGGNVGSGNIDGGYAGSGIITGGSTDSGLKWSHPQGCEALATPSHEEAMAFPLEQLCYRLACVQRQRAANTSSGNIDGGNAGSGNTTGGCIDGSNTTGGNTDGSNSSSGNNDSGHARSDNKAGGNSSSGNTSGCNIDGSNTTGGSADCGNTRSGFNGGGNTCSGNNGGGNTGSGIKGGGNADGGCGTTGMQHEETKANKRQKTKKKQKTKKIKHGEMPAEPGGVLLDDGANNHFLLTALDEEFRKFWWGLPADIKRQAEDMEYVCLDTFVPWHHETVLRALRAVPEAEEMGLDSVAQVVAGTIIRRVGELDRRYWDYAQTEVIEEFMEIAVGMVRDLHDEFT